MTRLIWPPQGNPPRPPPERKPTVDPLPRAILRSLVSDLPGPKGETEAERAARFTAQLAEILSYKPRNTADAMLAAHCVMLRVLAQDAHRDAGRAGLAPEMAKKFLRSAKQFDKLLVEWKKTMARRQSAPVPTDPGLFRSLGLEQFLNPAPDDAGQSDEPFSAVIVPLHPAPKLLQ